MASMRLGLTAYSLAGLQPPEHLQHLCSHAQAVTDPASRVAEQRRVPWWR
jgi:hypothetical protein